MVKRFNSDMPSARQAKMNSMIQELISTMLLREEILNVKPLDVTISGVSVSPDLRQANIYIVAYPSGVGKKQKTEEKILKNLTNARRFVRLKISQSLYTRVCPEIHFFLDVAMKNASNFDKILNEVSR